MKWRNINRTRHAQQGGHVVNSTKGTIVALTRDCRPKSLSLRADNRAFSVVDLFCGAGDSRRASGKPVLRSGRVPIMIRMRSRRSPPTFLRRRLSLVISEAPM